MKNVILGLLFVGLSFYFYGCSVQDDQKKFKIAVASPLTGDIAPLGQGIKRGVILAYIEITNKYPEVNVDLAYFDDRATESEAVNVAQKIVADTSIIGVVGHLNSGCSIPASRVYNSKNILMITPASTNPKLTLQGYKNVFRLCPTDSQQGPVAARFLIKRGIKSVSVIDDKTEYGQGLAEEFRKEFEKLGGKVLSYDSIAVGTRDFKSLLTKVKSLNPQAIYFGGVYVEGSLLTKQADEVGLTVPFVGGDGLFTQNYINVAGNSSEGDIVTFIGEPIDETHPFYKKYRETFPKEEIEPFDYYSYEAAKIIFAAYLYSLSNSTSGGFDRELAIEYVAKNEHQGLSSKFKFDEKGDNLNTTFTIYQISDGRFKILEIVK